MPFVYDELRRQAHNMLRHERKADTLQTTALVHEVHMNLVGSPSREWENREHFFNVAAKVMRNIWLATREKECLNEAAVESLSAD